MTDKKPLFFTPAECDELRKILPEDITFMRATHGYTIWVSSLSGAFRDFTLTTYIKYLDGDSEVTEDDTTVEGVAKQILSFVKLTTG